MGYSREQVVELFEEFKNEHCEYETDYSACVRDYKFDEIDINKDAKFFGIIDAKEGSNLSQGTTHAKNYNQASTNLVASLIIYGIKSFVKYFLCSCTKRKDETVHFSRYPFQ